MLSSSLVHLSCIHNPLLQRGKDDHEMCSYFLPCFAGQNDSPTIYNVCIFQFQKGLCFGFITAETR